MVIAIIRIPKPNDETAAQHIEQRFADQLPAVAQSSGFLGFELLRPALNSTHYLSVSRWESREALQAWAAGQYHVRVHGQETPTGGEYTLPPSLELYELAVS